MISRLILIMLALTLPGCTRMADRVIDHFAPGGREASSQCNLETVTARGG